MPGRKAKQPEPVTVVEATRLELAELPGFLARSALAATALALAAELDEPGNSATSKSMCARALMDALEQLRELAPPRKESDGIDDLARRRERRRSSGVADAADLSRS